MPRSHVNGVGPHHRPHGRNPWDSANAFRVGALSGGLIGIGLSWLLGELAVSLVIGGAVIGGLVGYWTDTR